MNDDDAPGMEVGFAINLANSFVELARLDGVIDVVTANALSEFSKLEKASEGLINLGAATATVTTFGAETTRAAQTAARELKKVESAGEGLLRQLERQSSTFGKTREEVRGMKVETAALAAEQQGLTELAGRLRAAEQALYDQEFAAARRARIETEAAAEARQAAAASAESEARAVREAAQAHAIFEAKVRQGLVAMREQDAVIASDTAALQRFRDMLDPTAAAQTRLASSMAEAERLMLAAGHSGEDVARVQGILSRGFDSTAGASARMGHSLTQLSFQANDMITMWMLNAPPMQIFMSQAGQIVQIAQTAEGGLKGLATSVWALVAPFAAVAVVAGVAALGVAAWVSYSNALEKFNGVANGTGRLIGATGGDLEVLAETTARAADTTVGAARDIVAAYAATGQIGMTVLPGLAAATEEFARATGQNADEASKMLASAFTDPAKGAEDLTVKYGLLDAASLAYIQDLAQQGRQTEAQIALLKHLEGGFDGAAEHAGILTRAWRGIASAASSAWTEMGKAIDIALGGGSTLDKLNKAFQDRNKWLNQTGGYGDTSVYDQQIAQLRSQLAAEKNRATTAAANSQAVGALKIVDTVTGNSQLGDLKGQLGQVNKLLVDNGRAARLSADQLRDARQAQEALTHAVTTYLSPADKAIQLAQVDAKIAAAKTPDAKAALAAQRQQIQSAGQVITAAQAQAEAQGKAAAASAQASKSTTNHAERLARDADAIRAQTSNLYQLAKAYGMSDAAALVAEARVKAESQAIKNRGDVEASVNRQVQLVIAQRVADGEKGAAASRAQATAQEDINAMVAAGLVPAERASVLLRDRMADLPLLAALEAAQQRGLADEAKLATKALEDQRAARVRLEAAEADARFIAGQRGDTDRLEILRAELQLVGAVDAARVQSLATLKAWQEAQAQDWGIDRQLAYVQSQVAIANQQQANLTATNNYNASLQHQAELLDVIDQNAQNAARGMADAFGSAGQAIGDLVTTMSGYAAQQERLATQKAADIKSAGADAKRLAEIEQLYAAKSATAQIGLYGDLTTSAKGFFKEGSSGYKALGAAEKAFRLVEFALSAQSVVVKAAETAAKLPLFAAQTSAAAATGAANMFATLGPAGFAAVAAMSAVLLSFGFRGGAGGSAPVYNEGKGTVFGDSDAKSDSIKRSLDLLADLDTEGLIYSQQMAASLKNIESQIGGVTNLVLRNGLDDVEAKLGVKTGFNSALPGFVANPTAMGAAIGGVIAGPIGAVIGAVASKLPVISDILGGISSIVHSLFGSKKTVVGSGLYGTPQTLGAIESLGFSGQTFADIKKTKKFFGISTGSSYSTQYGDLDDGIENQFGLLLTSFGDAVKAAAGPLGVDLGTIEAKLSTFVVDIGKIDLKDLTGGQIQEKLEAVFGAQADKMAEFAIAGLDRFQKVGEGYFETLIRVASTVDVVTTSLNLMGLSAKSLGVDASMAITGYFDSVSDYQSAADSYFQSYYTDAEQAAAKAAQLGKVFDSLGVTMPDSIATYRQLVEAQDLTSAAGQQLYAQLLQLAPAFAQTITAGTGQQATTAAAILRERADLEKQLMQAQGDTAGLRALELAQLDPSNRALQARIYALNDEAAAAAAATAASQAIANERAGLQRQLLELNGDTAAIRELDLAKTDESNRALLQEIYARQDAIAAQQAQAAAAQEAQRAAEEAARAADQLREAWSNIADSIMDEVKRIRGVPTVGTVGFDALQRQFNATTEAARGGDQAAAKLLPELSKSLLDAVGQSNADELMVRRISAVTAASLEQTYAIIKAVTGGTSSTGGFPAPAPAAATDQQPWYRSFLDLQASAATSSPANDPAAEIRALRDAVDQMRQENNTGNARIIGEMSKVNDVLDEAAAEGDGALGVKLVA